MSAGAPPVSIGLPVYNGERYLREALESLLAQTYVDFELVIGDNGSSDGTEEIARDAASRDPRVRYISSDENRGAAWNYNRVFHATSGQYFRWAAYDDLVAPTHLQRLVETLDSRPTTTVLARCLTAVIDETSQEVGVWDDRFDVSSEDPARRFGEVVRHVLKGDAIFSLIRRSALERTRLHGAYPSADWVLLAELALLGTFAVVPERLFLRRVHPDMSRLSHRGLLDVAEWFEPGTGHMAQPEFLRLFVEHLRAISRSPLTTRRKMKTVGIFVPVWLGRHKRAMADELWDVTVHRARPASH